MMRRLRNQVAWTIPWTLIVAAMGCGVANRAAVDGYVTLDGRPVKDGSISFIPVDGNHGRAAWDKIEAGRYSISVKQGPAVGTNQVEIRWPRTTGKMLPAVPPAPASEQIVEAIPARYNGQSELKAEIKPGQNEVNFLLKSK